MKIYNLNINTHFNEENLNLTIGNFDGIHNGHQYVIDQLVKTSKTLHYKSCLLSFMPHPRQFFSNSLNNNENFNIITIEAKKEFLKQLGLDVYIDFEFN